MDRFEYLPCLYRDADGRIREMPYPTTEPDPYVVPADLYAPSYCVSKGLLGSPRLQNLEVVIFNTRAYRPDRELEEEAKGRLLETILEKEGSAVVEASGGLDRLRAKIDVGPFWEEPDSR